MKTIALDVDGVLIDCSTPVHEAAQRILGKDLPPPSEWRHFSFGDAMQLSHGENEQLHKTLIRRNSLAFKLPWMPGAQEFVRTLSKSCDVIFVTSHWRGMPAWVPQRDAMLGAAFPGIDVVYTHSKWRVKFDLLVDDKVTTILENAERGLLFDQPWNQHAPRHLRRVYNYSEVLEICAS